MNIYNSLGSNYSRDTGAFKLSTSPGAPARLKSFLKQYYQVADVVVTYKGREAIGLVLDSLQLPAGSLVAINGYTCYAVYEAIIAAGLKPAYLDIEKDNLNFSAERLEQALKSQPEIKAVMIQNSLGIPCDMTAIKKLCDQHKIPLVEDLAHSIGLTYPGGQAAGTVGEAAALSFSQDKMIDAITGGAAVFSHQLTSTPTLQTAPLWHRFTTRLYPYSTWLIRGTIRIQIGRILLKVMKSLRLLPGPMSGTAKPLHKLPAWYSTLALRDYQNLPRLIAHRQAIAAVYRKWLPSDIQFQAGEEAVFLRFPIRVTKPLALISHMRRYGVFLSDRWYDAPLATAPKQVLSQTTYKKGDCPNAEYVAARMVNLPTHIHVSPKQAREIAERINEWLKSQ